MASSVRQNDDLAARYEKLTERLALVCKENSALTNKVALLEQEKESLTKTPFDKDSALGQVILAAEKGVTVAAAGKNGAKEQLQKLCASLQKEYVEYKTIHTHSDEEYESLTKQLLSSQNKSAELAGMLRDLSFGNISGGSGADKTSRAGVHGKQIEELKAEVARLQKELKGSTNTIESSMGSLQGKNELQLAKAEISTLKQELETVKKALATEESLHKMKVEESAELTQRLESLRAEHKEEIQTIKKKSSSMERNDESGELESSFFCQNCRIQKKELESLKDKLMEAQDELTRTRSQVSQSVSSIERKCASVEAKLIETQAELVEKDLQLSHSVSQASYDLVSAERKKLLHEVALMKERVSYLEKVGNRGTGDVSNALDDEEILAALERYKERICTLEFEKEQLANSVRALEKKLVEIEAKRAEELRVSEADRQRVAFLIKKSTNLASELRELRTEKDNLSDTLVTAQAELQRAQRQVDTIPTLRKRIEEFKETNHQLEERLSSAKEMEERLVTAKETIAYMELSQSRCISLAQYAEMQAEKQKLENSLSPLQNQLDDAKKEIVRLSEELQKCASKAQTEKDQLTMENLQDELDGLRENERILMEKLGHYKEENQRLSSLNVTLDAQMASMEHGIKEMATHMEKVRTEAKEAAEKAAEKEVARLREELEHAKSTIAGVQATEGQYVAEGLYLSAVEEKQELFNEVQQKTLELEKMKSEISIYRQTIKEFETENTEYVLDIEELQKKLNEEKVAAEQRQVEHEKQLVDIQEEVLDLQDLVRKQKTHLEANDVLIEELKLKNSNLEQMNEQISMKHQKLLQEEAKTNSVPGENHLPASLSGVSETNSTNKVAAGGVTPAPSSVGTGEPSSSSPPPKKKVKKIKKKKTLAEQLDDDVEEDVLQVAESRICASAVPMGSLSREARETQSSSFPLAAGMEGSHASRSAEIERLQNENITLKKAIEMLNDEADQLRAQLEAASRSGASAENASSDLAQLQKELQDALALAENMKAQRDQARMECKRVKALNIGGSGEREKELERELDEVRAELEVVASQLLPLKEKLSEYMAMADRIGIPYPFSEEYERRLARKMRSLKKFSEVL